MNLDDAASQRMSSALELLNARIARLAIALNVPLDDARVLDQLMNLPPAATAGPDRRNTSDRRVVIRTVLTVDRRVMHQREELRGLLVLRYTLETRSIHENGLDQTRQMMTHTEEHLMRQGFKPGANGLGLDKLFN